MCPHQPPCPSADRPDCHAAHTVAFHPGQGWSLLCNGVIVFDDMGEILPGGRVLPRTARPASGFPPRREERARALAMRQIRSATASNFVPGPPGRSHPHRDRKSTRLNSSHVEISYAVFCLKKKKKKEKAIYTKKKKKNINEEK